MIDACFIYATFCETNNFKNVLNMFQCFSPTETATKDYVMSKNGCGGCDPAALKAKTCEECTTTKCNSASNLAYALIPLLAVIFHAL
jgi:hypothetical protein